MCFFILFRCPASLGYPGYYPGYNGYAPPPGQYPGMPMPPQQPGNVCYVGFIGFFKKTSMEGRLFSIVFKVCNGIHNVFAV